MSFRIMSTCDSGSTKPVFEKRFFKMERRARIFGVLTKSTLGMSLLRVYWKYIRLPLVVCIDKYIPTNRSEILAAYLQLNKNKIRMKNTEVFHDIKY